MTYGCHNRSDYNPTVLVQDGWKQVGWNWERRIVTVPFRMNKECQYTHSELSKTDNGCDGCVRRVK